MAGICTTSVGRCSPGPVSRLAGSSGLHTHGNEPWPGHFVRSERSRHAAAQRYVRVFFFPSAGAVRRSSSTVTCEAGQSLRMEQAVLAGSSRVLAGLDQRHRLPTRRHSPQRHQTASARTNTSTALGTGTAGADLRKTKIASSMLDTIGHAPAILPGAGKARLE